MSGEKQETRSDSVPNYLAEQVVERVRNLTGELERKLEIALHQAKEFRKKWNADAAQIEEAACSRFEVGPKTMGILERIAVALEKLVE